LYSKAEGFNDKLKETTMINGNEIYDLIDCHLNGEIQIAHLCKYLDEECGYTLTETE